MGLGQQIFGRDTAPLSVSPGSAPPNPVTLSFPSVVNGPLEIAHPTATSITVTGAVTVNGAVTIRLTGCPRLRSISFTDLAVCDRFALVGVPSLEEIHAPALTNVYGSFIVRDCPLLTVLQLDALAQIGENYDSFQARNGSFSVERCAALPAISLPSLVAILSVKGRTHLIVTECAVLTTLAAPVLAGPTWLSAHRNPLLGTFDFAALAGTNIAPVYFDLRDSAITQSAADALLMRFATLGRESSLHLGGASNAQPSSKLVSAFGGKLLVTQHHRPTNVVATWNGNVALTYDHVHLTWRDPILPLPSGVIRVSYQAPHQKLRTQATTSPYLSFGKQTLDIDGSSFASGETYDFVAYAYAYAYAYASAYASAYAYASALTIP